MRALSVAMKRPAHPCTVTPCHKSADFHVLRGQSIPTGITPDWRKSMNGILRERRAFYNRGMTDSEISSRQSVHKTAIAKWRKSKGLPAFTSPRQPNISVTPMRRLLLDLGWGADSIARFQGVSADAVKIWKERRGLTSGGRAARMTDRQRRQQLQDLQRRVVRAVGCRLPFDIAADAAAELMLAVIEGTVPLDQIEKQGRAFGNRVLREYANPFTMTSLDEERSGHDGLRPIDMLVDGSSSAWLEEMGATVH